MPKLAKELSALEVKRLKHPGGKDAPVRVAVGGVSGLHLQITAGGGRSWVLRLSVGGKRRELGLGSYPEVGLADAHTLAREAKAKARQGVDPVAERDDARQALQADQRRALTYSEAVDGYMQIHRSKSEKNRRLVRNRLRTYSEDQGLGGKRVGEISKHDIKRVLEPVWKTKPSTALRLREDLKRVFDWAMGNDHMDGPNPAAWEGNLAYMLPEQGKTTEHRPAVPIDDAARWMAALRKRSGNVSRALEFLVLTAARSGEARGALWNEIDFKRGLWVVPAARMKLRKEHRVPLSTEAIKLLEAMPRNSDLIFPATLGGVLTDAMPGKEMKRIHTAAGDNGFVDRVSGKPAVPHGWRSTFKDWATEAGFDNIQSELALAHSVGNAVELAYRRTDLLERRRAMMEAWASFLNDEVPQHG